jgi:hypothetical protein
MGVKKLKQSFLNLPLLLALGMGTCVLFTGFVSYTLGDAALEGVTQPETNPTQKFLDQPSEAAEAQATTKFTPVNIAQTAKETRMYIQKQQKAASKANKSDGNTPDSQEAKSPEGSTEKKP